MSMMIHRAVLRQRELERKAAENSEAPKAEKETPKPSAPKRGRKPKR